MLFVLCKFCWVGSFIRIFVYLTDLPYLWHGI